MNSRFFAIIGTCILVSGLSFSFESRSETVQKVLLTTPVQATVVAGKSFNLTYNLQVLPTSLNYTFFVHFINASGTIVFGDDHSPATPTTAWNGNFVETRSVAVPSSVPAGVYRIRVGLYRPVEGRLPLQLGYGVADLGSASYEIGTVVVNASGSLNSSNCSTIPSIPTPPANAKVVTSYGAIPDDLVDDSDHIQTALDSLVAGDTLVFPPGKYLTNKTLIIKVAGTTLYGAGAQLHRTNPDQQALIVRADNTKVYSFKITSVTTDRKTAPWHTGIAVYKVDNLGKTILTKNVTIQGNQIVNSGAPGTNEANSASGGGILVLKTEGFLVAQNTVARTLADGIHISSGSSNGRVINNVVRETGDDMIAVVSYALSGKVALNTAANMESDWTNRENASLNKNILIANNTVSGQYWGRGITVVGGTGVTIRGNKLDNVPLAAAILVAREAGYQTYGVDNVLIDSNYISRVQTAAPPYDVNNIYANATKTHHGALEIHSFLFNDEAASPFLRSKLVIKNVLARDNRISETLSQSVRVGTNGTFTITDTDTNRLVVTRTGSAKGVGVVALERTTMKTTSSLPMTVNGGSDTGSLYCSANKVDGVAYSPSACTASALSVSGASLSCNEDGIVQ